jgi:hypothetical protein
MCDGFGVVAVIETSCHVLRDIIRVVKGLLNARSGIATRTRHIQQLYSRLGAYAEYIRHAHGNIDWVHLQVKEAKIALKKFMNRYQSGSRFDQLRFAFSHDRGTSVIRDIEARLNSLHVEAQFRTMYVHSEVPMCRERMLNGVRTHREAEGRRRTNTNKKRTTKQGNKRIGAIVGGGIGAVGGTLVGIKTGVEYGALIGGGVGVIVGAVIGGALGWFFSSRK